MIHLPLAMIAALGVWSPIHAQAAEPAKEKVPMEGMKMESCRTMMEQKQEMMMEMKAQDAKLAKMAADMKEASGDKKVEMMSSLLASMVEQQAAMHQRMEAAQGKMMGHMMEHMEMGKESMAGCPMMKGMMKGSAKEEGAKKE